MDKRTEKVIAWVNRLREKWNLPPIADLAQGDTEEGHSCPIAVSLDDNVWVGFRAKDYGEGPLVVERFNREVCEVPQYVRDWIDKFDTYQKYSEYIQQL